DLNRRCVQPTPSAAALVRLLPPGGFDQNAPHRLSRGGKEVPAAVPAGGFGRSDEPQVRLVDPSGRLKGLPRGLGRHSRGGELPQLVVDEREHVGRSLAVPGGRGVEEASHLGHSESVTVPDDGGTRNRPKTGLTTFYRTLTDHG